MFLSKQKVLLAKEESTYGTDSTPTPAANAIDAKDIKISYPGEVLERPMERASLSPVAPKIGKHYIEVTFTCELKGSGSQGVAPAIGDLLEACGFAETVSAGSSVLYKPASTGHKSVTIYVYDIQAETGNSRLHKLTGARGNVNFVFEAGQIARLEFTFQGLYNIPTDVSTPDSASYESTTPPIVESSNFTLNSVDSLVVQSININMANELHPGDDINAAAGIKNIGIVGRKPNGSFNPEAVLLATYDFWTDWVNANQRALSLVVGSAAGNKCTISAPKVSIDTITEGDRGGRRIEDIPFKLNVDSGDDEIELKFE